MIEVFRRSEGRAVIIFAAMALLGLALSKGFSGTEFSLPAEFQRADPRDPIDVNRASFSELLTLPGIGPALAERILQYRWVHGPFRSVDDLLNVPGIGPRLLERLRDRVTAR